MVRCTCPDVMGIQVELEEQARLLQFTVRVAHTVKMARVAGFLDCRWLFLTSAHMSPAH